MTKMDKTIKDLSNLHSFYLNLSKAYNLPVRLPEEMRTRRNKKDKKETGTGSSLKK